MSDPPILENARARSQSPRAVNQTLLEMFSSGNIGAGLYSLISVLHGKKNNHPTENDLIWRYGLV